MVTHPEAVTPGLTSDHDELFARAWRHAIDLAIAEGWVVPVGSEGIRNASRLAVGGMLGTAVWCWCNACRRSCRHCSACGGSRKRLLDEQELAQLLGIGMDEFDRVWRARVVRIQQWLETEGGRAWDGCRDENS